MEGFIDDSNHSQGDGWMAMYMGCGKCQNAIDIDEETGEDVICGNPIGPTEQICFSCMHGRY